MDITVPSVTSVVTATYWFDVLCKKADTTTVSLSEITPELRDQFQMRNLVQCIEVGADEVRVLEHIEVVMVIKGRTEVTLEIWAEFLPRLVYTMNERPRATSLVVRHLRHIDLPFTLCADAFQWVEHVTLHRRASEDWISRFPNLMSVRLFADLGALPRECMHCQFTVSPSLVTRVVDPVRCPPLEYLLLTGAFDTRVLVERAWKGIEVCEYAVSGPPLLFLFPHSPPCRDSLTVLHLRLGNTVNVDHLVESLSPASLTSLFITLYHTDAISIARDIVTCLDYFTHLRSLAVECPHFSAGNGERKAHAPPFGEEEARAVQRVHDAVRRHVALVFLDGVPDYQTITASEWPVALLTDPCLPRKIQSIINHTHPFSVEPYCLK